MGTICPVGLEITSSEGWSCAVYPAVVAGQHPGVLLIGTGDRDLTTRLRSLVRSDLRESLLRTPHQCGHDRHGDDPLQVGADKADE